MGDGASTGMEADAVPDADEVLRELRSLEGEAVGVRRGHLAVIMLNRPQKGNAFDLPMLDLLGRLWRDLGRDPSVRAIVLTSSSDRHFCTGRDVSEIGGLTLPTPRDAPADDFVLTNRRAGVWVPVITAVEGLVMGAGLHFVLDSDLVVAGEGAAFGDSHVNVGLAGGIEVAGLVRKVGLGGALHLTLLGRDQRADAAWALGHGLVQEVVPRGAALQRALDMAHTISRNSPAAVTRTLQAGWHAAEHPETARDYAWQLIQRQLEHPDAAEGPRAWLERRPPEWLD